MHIDGFVRGKGKFVITEYVPTDEKTGPRFPLLLTTGRILSQYNVGAQTRRTENVVWHEEDVLEIHPHDAEQRGIRDGDWVQLASRAGETALARADHRPGGAGRRLHDLPPSRHAGQRRHHRVSPTGRPTAPNTRSRRCRSRRRTARRNGRSNIEELGAQQPAHRRDGRGRGVTACATPVDRPSTARCLRAGEALTAGRARAMPEETAVAFTYDGAYLRRDDGDAARSRGFRRRLQPDRRTSSRAPPRSTSSRSSSTTTASSCACGSSSRAPHALARAAAASGRADRLRPVRHREPRAKPCAPVPRGRRAACDVRASRDHAGARRAAAARQALNRADPRGSCRRLLAPGRRAGRCARGCRPAQRARQAGRRARRASAAPYAAAWCC